MNVEIGAEAALFPEREYINGIAVAVQDTNISYPGQRFFNVPYRAVHFLSSICSECTVFSGGHPAEAIVCRLRLGYLGSPVPPYRISFSNN
jgi:hypothetical protein